MLWSCKVALWRSDDGMKSFCKVPWKLLDNWLLSELEFPWIWLLSVASAFFSSKLPAVLMSKWEKVSAVRICLDAFMASSFKSTRNKPRLSWTDWFKTGLHRRWRSISIWAFKVRSNVLESNKGVCPFTMAILRPKLPMGITMACSLSSALIPKSNGDWALASFHLLTNLWV